MELLGFQARAPRGVKLSKPPPRKLTPNEIIKERLDNMNFNNGIQEFSDLEQSRFLEINNNEVEKVYRMTPTVSDQGKLNGSITNNNGCNENNDNSSMRQRARAPRIVKLTKPRPLKHRLPSMETDPPPTVPGQTTEQVNERMPSIETVPPPTVPGQNTEQVNERMPSIETVPPPTVPGQTTEQVNERMPSIETVPPPTVQGQTTELVKEFNAEFFCVKSADEAEDKILAVIEKLGSLDQTRTQLFQDILVKYGAQLEKDNPAFIRSCLACVEEFLKRDSADASVRAILQNILFLRKHSWRQLSGEQDAKIKGAHEKCEDKQLDKKSVMNIEQTVSRTISCDSGYGDQDDVVLWTNEDSFIQDLSENLKAYDVEEDDLMADGKKTLAHQTKEAVSYKTGHGFMSKHFEPTTTEEKPPLYSTKTNWSDAVKKQNDSIKSCANLETEFTKLKGHPINDDAKNSGPTRSGFEEVKTKSDTWMSASQQNFSSHRTGNGKSYSHSWADQESWRKPQIRQGFGNPGKMSTVPEEGGNSNEESIIIPPRPKHLILKDRVSSRQAQAKVVVVRHPLGPGDEPSVIAKVEEGLPKSIYSAAGRRAMFKKYNTAVCLDDIDSDDLEELEPITYSREELLILSNSPLSRRRPTESSYLCKLYPYICLEKAEAYFSSRHGRDNQRPSTSIFYVKQKKENSERDFLSNSLECESQQQKPECRRFGFQTREQKFEFGSHKNFPQTSVWGPSAVAQEHSKSVFGSNANFIPKDFRSCALSMNEPIMSLK